ncbi:hypothetical protein DFH28DRAFT_1128363 [Melampsora americana]|nr:hypothetical protein DFH28DRAFT_1128363 [Melampsora americana]
MTLTGFKNNSNLDQDIRTRPRKRAREAINTSIGSSPVINSKSPFFILFKTLIQILQLLIHPYVDYSDLQLIRRLSFQRQRAIEPDPTFDEVFIRLRPHPGVQLTTVIFDPLPIYHTARALPSPTYLRLLIEALMERLLPAEDWAPKTERLIIREILLNVILAPLFSEPPSPSQTSPPISLPSRILGCLNRVIHFLLLLPSLYQSLTQLPPIGTRDDPNIFEPTLSLLATILGASEETHVRQLCWILGLFLRLFQNILTRLLVHSF